MAAFNEDTRVKIPALIHLTRLGYTYLSLKHAEPDARTNIFPDLFETALARINPDYSQAQITRELEEITLALQNEDLGQAFHQMLLRRSGLRLIDFEHFDNNSFHCVTELPYENGEESFRPDITLLINGMPLVLIEVKKRLNRGGVLEERVRMNRRHRNRKLRHFFNLTQLMIFSNNMEYDASSIEPIQGAFYAASTYGKAHFNYFREEQHAEMARAVRPIDDSVEQDILIDTNRVAIRGTPEFVHNKSLDTPTNRLCTSLLSRARLAFLLRYAFAYVDTAKGIEKHVMRYPQLFATQAIARHLSDGVRRGIIWQ